MRLWLAGVLWRGILAAVLIMAAVSAAACASTRPGPRGVAAPASPAAGVTLEAEVPQPGLVVMRSPSFR